MSRQFCEIIEYFRTLNTSATHPWFISATFF